MMMGDIRAKGTRGLCGPFVVLVVVVILMVVLVVSVVFIGDLWDGIGAVVISGAGSDLSVVGGVGVVDGVVVVLTTLG